MYTFNVMKTEWIDNDEITFEMHECWISCIQLLFNEYWVGLQYLLACPDIGKMYIAYYLLQKYL